MLTNSYRFGGPSSTSKLIEIRRMLTKGGLSKKRHVSHLADHTAFERKSKEQRTKLSHGGWPVSINPLLATALWGKPDSTRDFV